MTVEPLSTKGKNSMFKRLKCDPITKMYMPYGNGCWRCNNCFECTCMDCQASSQTVVDKPPKRYLTNPIGI